MDSVIQDLVREIKKKKELQGIADSVIINELQNYKKKTNLDFLICSTRDKKQIIKDIRAPLRKYTGRFQSSTKERTSLLKSGKIDELLATHSSTAERLEFYPELRSLIAELGVNSILDLGCGINPIALADNSKEYYASDIREDELKLVKSYFEKYNIHGKVFVYDLKKIDNSLPKVDLCLLLKVVDVIENKNHKLTEKIISLVNSKYFIISFSTKTLSGKPMNHPQRGWIERLLERLKKNYATRVSKNEIFYIISNQEGP